MKSRATLISKYFEDPSLYLNTSSSKQKILELEEIIDNLKSENITLVSKKKEKKPNPEHYKTSDWGDSIVLKEDVKFYPKLHGIIYRFKGEEQVLRDFEKMLVEILEDQSFIVFANEQKGPPLPLDEIFLNIAKDNSIK